MPNAFNIVLDNNFKWDIGSPLWSSVFIGSSDEITHGDEIIKQLSHYGKDEVELVSVIGGMKFLTLLEKRPFGKITLFDKNINEIAKFAMVYDHLEQTPFQQYNYFKPLHNQIKEDPKRFYLSAYANDKFNLLKTENFTFTYRNRTAPLDTLLDPESYPEYRWTPDEPSYNKVRQALKENLNHDFYLDIPPLDAKGKVVVVYLSHCPISRDDLRNKIKNASLILPLYANVPGIKNESLLDPHPYWEQRVNQFKMGRSLHIWSPEDSKYAGSPLDRSFTKGIKFKDFAKGKFQESFDTVISHIFFGKCKDDKIDKRIKLYQSLVQKAKQIGRRIIITDHYKESGQFAEMNGLIGSRQIMEITEKILTPEFQKKTVCFSAGYGSPERNIHIIYDRQNSIA